MPVSETLILSREAAAVVLTAVTGPRGRPGRAWELDREAVGADEEEAWRELGRRHPGATVTLLVPPELLLVRRLVIPSAARSPENLVRFEASRVLPLPIEELSWAWQETFREGDTAEILLFVAKAAAVEALCAAATSGGFRIATAWPATRATLAGFRVRTAEDPAKPALLFAGGGRGFEVVLVEGTRTAARAAMEATESRDGWFAEVTRSLATFRRSGFKAERPALWIAGALPAELESWRERWQARGGGEVRAAETIEALRRTGLAALRGGGDRFHSDLLPPARRAEAAWRRRGPWLAASAIAALAALVPPVGQARAEARSVRSQADRLAAELVPLQTRAAARAAQRERLMEIERALARLAAEEDERRRWCRLLADLEGRVGAVGDAWLERMAARELSAEDGAAGVSLEIEGWIIDRANPEAHASEEVQARARELLRQLRSSPHVSLVSGERLEVPASGLVRFQCVLRVEGGRGP